MARALLAASLLLATSLVLAPTASADHVAPTCPIIDWAVTPPGWDTYCSRVEPRLLEVVHNAATAAECLGTYDPFIHGLNHVIACAKP